MATPITVGVAITATTTGVAQLFDVCPGMYTGQRNAGRWYSFVGTGGSMTATTCSDPVELNASDPWWGMADTVLAVYGRCDGGCLYFNDDACDLLSRVTFPTVAGSVYHVLVSGYGSRRGPFALLVTNGTGAESSEQSSSVPISSSSSSASPPEDNLTLVARPWGDRLYVSVRSTRHESYTRVGLGECSWYMWGWLFYQYLSLDELRRCTGKRWLPGSTEVFDITASRDGSVVRLWEVELSVGDSIDATAATVDVLVPEHRHVVMDPGTSSAVAYADASYSVSLGRYLTLRSGQRVYLEVTAGSCYGYAVALRDVRLQPQSNSSVVAPLEARAEPTPPSLCGYRMSVVVTAPPGFPSRALLVVRSAVLTRARSLGAREGLTRSAGLMVELLAENTKGTSTATAAIALALLLSVVAANENSSTGDAEQMCRRATPIAVGVATTGTTTGVAQEVDVCPGLCGIRNAGLWYSFVGTGGSMTASTCRDRSNSSESYGIADTVLAVYERCDGGCRYFNDDACVFFSRVTFPTVAGSVYHVLVSGYGSRRGSFTLLVSNATQPAQGNSTGNSTATNSSSDDSRGHSGASDEEASSSTSAAPGVGDLTLETLPVRGDRLFVSVRSTRDEANLTVHLGRCPLPFSGWDYSAYLSLADLRNCTGSKWAPGSSGVFEVTASRGQRPAKVWEVELSVANATEATAALVDRLVPERRRVAMAIRTSAVAFADASYNATLVGPLTVRDGQRVYLEVAADTCEGYALGLRDARLQSWNSSAVQLLARAEPTPAGLCGYRLSVVVSAPRGFPSEALLVVRSAVLARKRSLGARETTSPSAAGLAVELVAEETQGTSAAALPGAAVAAVAGLAVLGCC
eukprot:m51a1_g12637 hypothetical protein (862) ;mRNA; f:21-3568